MTFPKVDTALCRIRTDQEEETNKATVTRHVLKYLDFFVAYGRASDAVGSKINVKDS